MMKSVSAMPPRHDERRHADQVDDGFWPKIRRLAARLPFAEDLLAAYYAAADPQTPIRARAVLLAGHILPAHRQRAQAALQDLTIPRTSSSTTDAGDSE